MTNYTRGRHFEYRCRDVLESVGYLVARAAGSKGPADLVALRKDGPLLVQCKTSGKCDPKEWNELFDDARRVGATPVLAYRPTPKRLEFCRMLRRKDGSGGRQPMEAMLLVPEARPTGAKRMGSPAKQCACGARLSRGERMCRKCRRARAIP